ncbi:MAG: pyridoxamine 5'-phosphate oxidase family protein [Planctomycetaceae bacterium]|jgi:nitroimidazol reductase NimA-like FMN-containing flavoprotein (pyridoxamine 5'-phosphate oxidase superfamily)|nr:pyridoxamine 5'-phosphate oxidase family protein [Planctomycetaceae bacterium]
MSLRPISYQARICADENRIDAFLEKSRVGIIGVNAGEYPYAIPVNYLWRDGCVYFHGMGSGRKTELLSENGKVCFTVYQELGTVKDNVPCHADTSYFSVMLFGNAVRITDHEKAAVVLNQIVEKFMPGFFSNSGSNRSNNPISASLVETYHSSKDGNGVMVYCIKPEFITAKENQAEEDDLVSPNTEGV